MRSFMGRLSSGSKSESPPKAPWFEAAFDTYCDPADGQIGPEGIEKLCTALGADPTDVLVLVLAWQLGASQMGYFSREEWASGAGALAVATSPESLLDRLKQVYEAARKSKSVLRDLHNFTHKFCREERKKNIDVGAAVAMLELLHGNAFPQHVPPLCEFLQGHAETAKKRGVSADEWSMILNFFSEVAMPDCSNYQDDGAWPLLLDDFVDWQRERQGGASTT
jgi:DCN1-like protein 4/5